MTTLIPRAAYTPEEIEQLYPPGLQLKLVQVLLRHGERTPVSTRFAEAGLWPHWPYCRAARRMASAVMQVEDARKWSQLQWQRQIETFGTNDAPATATGPQGEVDGICNLGELTDKGRQTTLALGRRLRRLYVHQLGFLPPFGQHDMLYLRATPMVRALESVQQTLVGLYPDLERPTIVTRTFQQETLFPNEANCARFSQLTQAFADRTALRWNQSPEMGYVNERIRKYMPQQSAVAVDSHPRLSGILDTINSTLAHGPETRLPKEFYEDRLRNIIERIELEEWFAGYNESQEYRMLGTGALAADIVTRMMARVRNESPLRLGLSGCHDTTLAALLSSLGCFAGERWPPYSSHVAVELFGAAAARDEHFVRIRFNDKPMILPGCRAPGDHLPGSPSFCTLVGSQMRPSMTAECV